MSNHMVAPVLSDMQDSTVLRQLDPQQTTPIPLQRSPWKRAALGDDQLPAAWYNVVADLPGPVPPPLNPSTGRPLQPAELEPILSRALIDQEFTEQRWIDIPDEIRRGLAIWRPTPLVRARGLERALKTPARIYFKDESQSPPGSHKPNTAIPQAYYSKQEGVARLTTETGAGQWGCSLALACSLFGLECKVYMVRLTHQQRPYRRSMIRLWGGQVTASPSQETEAGRQMLAVDPNCPGSLGIAISEAVETAYHCDQTKYAMGSVLNHVMLHQSVIGLETQHQFELFGDSPDVIIGCAGGGSNFAGLAFPYIPWKLRGREIRLVAAESRACPTMTRGQYRYDFGDTTCLTPLVKMLTLGHSFVPPRIEAGGLRYHGMAPLVSLAARLGLVEAVAYNQIECFEAAKLFAATEGIIPALETAHAIRATVAEAIRCRETGQEKCIAVSFSGHGLCDLGSYDRYLSGELEDIEVPPGQIDAALAELPDVE
jgi:tryptophan synthase beta chain